MQRETPRSLTKSKTLLLGSMSAVLVIMIICFPEASFQASLQGLQIWWKLVFPALLPFLILTEILIGLGIIQALGTLLHPFMRTIFRLPGVGGWALASGLLVGFPSGAKITSDLLKKGLLTREEGERLAAISHLCSPLFLITVVGVGFLQSARLGVALAIVHYISALAAALFLLNKADRQSQSIASKLQNQPAAGFIETMRDAYLQDGRPFGKLLGDSVSASIHALMLIGGYMMIFSVIINVISLSGIQESLHFFIQALLGFTYLGPDSSSHILNGIFEIHLGAYAFSQSQEIPLVWQLAFMGAFLGWGGFSAHAQVSGLTNQTPIRYVPFFAARFLHGALAFILTLALWKPLQLFVLNESAPSFVPTLGRADESSSAFVLKSSWSSFIPTLLQLLVLLAIMLAVSFTISRYLRQSSKN